MVKPPVPPAPVPPTLTQQKADVTAVGSPPPGPSSKAARDVSATPSVVAGRPVARDLRGPQPGYALAASVGGVAR
jgi:hypothetical protein